MTKATVHKHAPENERWRVGVILAIGVAYLGIWLMLTGLSDGMQQGTLWDRAICGVTFVSCLRSSPYEALNWQFLLMINAVSLLSWMVFLTAARSFVKGRTTARRMIGLLFSILIPLLILTVLFLGILISSVS